MNILVVTSVEAERSAIERAVKEATQASFEVISVGVGTISAAIQCTLFITSHIHSLKTIDAIICAGIGGQFINGGIDEFNPGEICLASRTIVADAGAESMRGFLTLEQLGFGVTMYEANQQLLHCLHNSLSCQTGDIITVTTATGTTTTTNRLRKRWPGAMIEAMEGGAVAAVAKAFSIPFIELRSVSNLVGPRRRNEWQIPAALDGLEQAFRVIAKIDFSVLSQKEGDM